MNDTHLDDDDKSSVHNLWEIVKIIIIVPHAHHLCSFSTCASGLPKNSFTVGLCATCEETLEN